jgi:hypothetical protein
MKIASTTKACFLLGFFFKPEDGGKLTFNGLHGPISQDAELFITTAVITSNATHVYYLFVEESYLSKKQKQQNNIE